MNYFDYIKKVASVRNISLSRLASAVDQTVITFEKSLRQETLNIQQVKTICSMLSINVTDLFDNRTDEPSVMQKRFGFLSNKVFC